MDMKVPMSEANLSKYFCALLQDRACFTVRQGNGHRDRANDEPKTLYSLSWCQYGFFCIR